MNERREIYEYYWAFEAGKSTTRNSAKLTDQRGRYAFTCSPFSIHLHHILPTSIIDILVYYLFSIDISEQHVWQLTLPLHRTPVNNPIKLTSSVIWFLALHFCRGQFILRSANFKTVLSESHRFRCQWGTIKGLHSTQYCGLWCEGLDDSAQADDIKLCKEIEEFVCEAKNDVILVGILISQKWNWLGCSSLH